MGTRGEVKSAAVWRTALLALSVLTWLACFAVLRRWGTWTPFAVAGLTLASLALIFDAARRALLHPSTGALGVGLGAGALMVALTHLAFAAIALLWPGVRPATSRLYGLLNVRGSAPAPRMGLVCVIATCEEVLFRGERVGPGKAGGAEGPLEVLSWRGLARIAISAACYALSSLSLGSALLVGCAFACALAWGGLRLATRSLVAPIAAHILWDLGVLVVWPLV